MRLELSNPRIFKDIFESITHIVDEIQLNFDNDGIHCNALDKSHITFCNLELKPSLFDEYECNTPENVLLDTERFMKILKRMNNNDIMRMGLDEGNFIIIFEGDATREYKIRLLYEEYESPQPPMIDHPVYVNIPTNVMLDSLKDLDVFSENLSLSVDEDYLFIKGGTDFGDGEIKYLHGETVQEYVESKFNINNLNDMFRSSKLSKYVKLGLGTDMPLKVLFELTTGEGELSFLLAPRISNEDEV